MYKETIKDAMEAQVCKITFYAKSSEVHYAVQYPIGYLPHAVRDKVKVIIIKEK